MDRGLEIAELVLAKTRDLAQPVHTRLLVRSVRLCGAEKDVPEVTVATSLPQEILEETDRVGVDRVDPEDVAIEPRGLVLPILRRQLVSAVEETRYFVDAAAPVLVHRLEIVDRSFVGRLL